MSFRENVRPLQRALGNAGYEKTNDPIAFSELKKGDRVSDCEIIARKDFFNVMYLEAESNWRSIASNVATNSEHPCMVITRYGDTHHIFTTVRDYGTHNARPRHVVLETGGIKSSSISEFILEIKAAPTDDHMVVDGKVQTAFDKFSEYRQAIVEFDKNLDRIINRIRSLVDQKISGNAEYEKEASKFLEVSRRIINEDMSLDDVRDMVIQHILTYKIFSLIYDERDFNTTNTVARSLEKLKNLLDVSDHVNYHTMELIAESLTDDDARQDFLKQVYETFYNKYDPGLADRDGIVYTPKEVVSFIVKSVDILLQEHFGDGLAGDNVTILDPFTGTGTFPVQVMQEIGSKRLEHKYDDIHASEISILPYYIAALNIEHTYKEITGRHREFENICWMDTFEKGTTGREKMGTFLEIDKNVERVTKQQKLKIRVIVGNPPYSAGQHRFDEQNPNQKYDELDKRVQDTYAKETKLLNKDIGRVASLYDSYVRSIRWASDRIGESGIVGFITNGSFIKSEVGAGIRYCMYEEFNEVWCFDLRGNARTQGEIRKKEAGNVFESGSRAPVAITLLVKNPTRDGCIIRYKNIGDYLDRVQKLQVINDTASIKGIQDWQTIKPDRRHDWLNKRPDKFYDYAPMGTKEFKSGKGGRIPIFELFSSGVLTSRDIWTYNSSKIELAKNMKRHIKYCNSQNLDDIQHDPRSGKWDRDLILRLKRDKPSFEQTDIRYALYRPFFKQYLFFNYAYNNMQYKIPKAFPKPDSKNLVICVPHKFTGKFSTFISNMTPDLELVHHARCFPLFIYDNNKKQENITTTTLNEYQAHYNDTKITKLDIFYYVYGLLHHPEYRSKYENNLSRDLPYIPMAPNFEGFRDVGKKLAELHLNYETCKRYNLGKPLDKFDSVTKLGFGTLIQGKKRVKDRTTLRINGTVVFKNIPSVRYMVNGRTPLEWVVDRYKVTTDKDSGIKNDPLDDVDIVAIIERAVYVGVESDRLIDMLPAEFEPKNWKPKIGLNVFLA